jgi:hypothetical protein
MMHNLQCFVCFVDLAVSEAKKDCLNIAHATITASTAQELVIPGIRTAWAKSKGKRKSFRDRPV